VAALNLSDRDGVGRAAGGGAQYGGYLTEEVWAEEAWSDDSEDAGPGGAEVVEAMHGSARNDDALAGAEFDLVAGNGEGERAF